MGDMKPDKNPETKGPKKENAELLKLGLGISDDYVVTDGCASYAISPKVSIADIYARRFDIVDRKPIGTPLVKIKSGMDEFMTHYGDRIFPESGFFPSHALVLSFHEPGDPAEVELFWTIDDATRTYYEWCHNLTPGSPWELTMYMISDRGNALRPTYDVQVVSNQKGEVVDVRWPTQLMIKHESGLSHSICPWNMMIDPPSLESSNP